MSASSTEPAPHPIRNLTLICLLVLGSLAFYLVFSRNFLEASRIQGFSMQPTYQPGDRVLLNRLVLKWRAPRRSDVVSLKFPDQETRSIKRVVGLPGETIRIHNGRIYINGLPLDEPYLTDPPYTSSGPLGSARYRIVDHTYFVLGDNRDQSVDSRMFGAIHRDRIDGIVYPLRF